MQYRDIIKKAKSVGINPLEIANETQVVLGRNTSQTMSQVLTSEEVDQAKRSFISNIQLFLKKYRIASEVEIGVYLDTRYGLMDGCSYVTGIFERFPDGNIQPIEPSKLSVEELSDPMGIFCNLIQKLTDLAQMNKSKGKDFESALKSINHLSKDVTEPSENHVVRG